MNITWVRTPTGGRQTSWLFTSVDEKLNSGLPRTTSARGQNGIWTRDLRISNPASSNHSATLLIETFSDLIETFSDVFSLDVMDIIIIKIIVIMIIFLDIYFIIRIVFKHIFTLLSIFWAPTKIYAFKSTLFTLTAICLTPLFWPYNSVW